jgi:hypothetical protein
MLPRARRWCSTPRQEPEAAFPGGAQNRTLSLALAHGLPLRQLLTVLFYGTLPKEQVVRTRAENDETTVVCSLGLEVGRRAVVLGTVVGPYWLIRPGT